MRLYFSLIISFIYCILSVLELKAQKSPFINPSFEGDSVGYPSLFWWDCYFSETTSNLQPGWAEVDIPPYEGAHYLGMVTRGGICVTCNESVFQALSFPLVSDTCYTFDIMLSHDKNAYTSNWTKAVLRIWGSNHPFGNCGKDELLWVSSEPTSNIWTKYQVHFKPSQNYTYLTLEAYYPPIQLHESPSPGHILIDYIHNFKTSIPFNGFSLGKDTSLCSDRDLLLRVNLPANQTNLPIRWSTGETSSKIKVSEPGIYWAEVQHPCQIFRDSIVVEHRNCFFIPNVFTPNQDGHNETFFIEGIHRDTWQLQVYDRKGALVYENPKYQNDWTGNNLPNAVYYYYLVNLKTKESYKGWVEIMR